MTRFPVSRSGNLHHRRPAGRDVAPEGPRGTLAGAGVRARRRGVTASMIAAIAICIAAAHAAGRAGEPQSLVGTTLRAADDGEALIGGLLEQLLGGGGARATSRAIERVVVVEDSAQRLVVSVTYSGLANLRLAGELRGRDRRRLPYIVAQPVTLTDAAGEAAIAFELQPGLPEGARIESASLRLVAFDPARSSVPVLSRVYALPKQWNATPAASNVIITVAPKAMGTAARLGSLPDYAAPPKVLVPIRAAVMSPAAAAASPAAPDRTVRDHRTRTDDNVRDHRTRTGDSDRDRTRTVDLRTGAADNGRDRRTATPDNVRDHRTGAADNTRGQGTGTAATSRSPDSGEPGNRRAGEAGRRQARRRTPSCCRSKVSGTASGRRTCGRVRRDRPPRPSSCSRACAPKISGSTRQSLLSISTSIYPDKTPQVRHLLLSPALVSPRVDARERPRHAHPLWRGCRRRRVGSRADGRAAGVRPGFLGGAARDRAAQGLPAPDSGVDLQGAASPPAREERHGCVVRIRSRPVQHPRKRRSRSPRCRTFSAKSKSRGSPIR